MQPHEAVRDGFAIEAAQAAKRSPQQLAERDLIGGDDSVVRSPLGPPVSIEDYEVPDVVSENRAPFGGRVFELLGVRPAATAGSQDVDRIEAPPAENIREQGADVLVKQQPYGCLQRPAGRWALSVFAASSRSILSR
jgi:hypothetical protein